MKQMTGAKHLIQCHCILPTLRKAPVPVYHSFVVFSVIDDEGNIVSKDAECNNCSVIHRVVDFCKSEITTKEKSSSIITMKDISMMISKELTNVLTSYDCDIATWEQAYFITSHKKWGEKITLTKELNDGLTKGKLLTFEKPNKFKIEPFERTENF